jgi:hypothetical protein
MHTPRVILVATVLAAAAAAGVVRGQAQKPEKPTGAAPTKTTGSCTKRATWPSASRRRG